MSGQGNDVPCCFSFQFYIKPQRPCKRVHLRGVVSHSNSTSNHNEAAADAGTLPVVSHSNSTSNHNISREEARMELVVSHSNSTSNHNCSIYTSVPFQLFLIPILHQTTTNNRCTNSYSTLFLIPILHQTTTHGRRRRTRRKLFLIPILHQTTTLGVETYTGD